MTVEEGVKALLMRIEDNCKLLYAGYSEKVEYKLSVAYHRNTCEHFGRTTSPRECPCPVAEESRVRNQRRPGLLDQLKAFAANKDTDRNPKAERGAPRVKVAGRPPGDLGGFFALDELSCAIPATVERVLIEAGRDYTWACQSVNHTLMGLSVQVGNFAEERPDLVREVDRAVTGWVESARSTLKITTAESIFDAVLCGNCSVGALSSPWGNRGETDVRCIGTPSEAPCGHTYPASEWVRLYEDHKRRTGS